MKNLIKYPVSIAAVTLTGISMYLTALLLYSTGDQYGLSIVFAITGIMFDITKAVLPAAIVLVHRSGKVALPILLSVLAVGLTVMSFSASVSAIDKGTLELVSNTDQYQTITKQVSVQEDRIASLKADKEELPTNYKTARREAQDEIDALQANVVSLLEKRSQLKPEALTDSYRRELAITVAFFIEAVVIGTSLLMVFLLGSGTSPSHPKNVSEPVPTRVEDVVVAVKSEPEVDPRIAQIKEAITAKKCKPSCSSVRKLGLGLGNDRISSILKELGGAGIIIPRRDGLAGWEYP